MADPNLKILDDIHSTLVNLESLYHYLQSTPYKDVVTLADNFSEIKNQLKIKCQTVTPS